MALTEAQRAENRKDRACGKEPRHKSPITAAAPNTVDGTYGADEAVVLGNARVRIGELEDALQDVGILP